MQRVLLTLRTILRDRDLTVLTACSMLLGLAYSFVIPFMSMFGTLEVKMSSLTFGTFMTVTSLISIVISTWLARWSDTHYSRKVMLLIGSSSGALGYVGYAFVRDVWQLSFIAAFVLGTSSITFSQVFAHARDVLKRSCVPPGEVPFYMNVFRLFFALSWTFGPAVAAQIMLRHSFRGTFLVAALIFVLLFVVVLVFVPRVPPSVAAREAAEQLPLRQALKSPALLAHFVAFVLYFCCSTMGMMNLPLLVLNTLHGNQGQVGIVYSVAPVFELPFMFYIGWLATRGDQARLIRNSFALAVVYYALLAVVGAPWHVYPVQILSAAIVAVTGGVAITFFQNFLPDQPGTATNLYSNASRIGATAGYLLFGVLTAEGGHRGVFLACTAFCSIAVGILFAFRPRLTARLPA